MSRDTDRIDLILEEFGIYWRTNPDLRFGQLFANLTGHHRDAFYVTDQVLIDALGVDAKEFTADHIG